MCNDSRRRESLSVALLKGKEEGYFSALFLGTLMSKLNTGLRGLASDSKGFPMRTHYVSFFSFSP